MRDPAELLSENSKLNIETNTQKKIIKNLTEELERAQHPNRGTSPDRGERGITVRWARDPIAETISVLVKVGNNRGIVVELFEGELYERGTSRAQFPRVAVRGDVEVECIHCLDLPGNIVCSYCGNGGDPRRKKL